MPVLMRRPGFWRWGLLLAACLLLDPVDVVALDLLGAYRQAIENDAGFLAAKASAAAAREAVPQARAGLLPNLSFSGSRSKTSTDITQNNIYLGKVTTHFDYMAEGQYLTLRQPLYRSANLAQYRQAEAQVAGAEMKLKYDRQHLAVQLAEAYFDVLAARDQQRFAAQQREAYFNQWKRAAALLAKGAGTRTDRDEAKARYDEAVAQEVDAGDAVDMAERTLAAITGHAVPAAALAVLDSARLPLRPPTPASFDKWVALGVKANPELASMRYDIAAAQQDVKKQRAGRLPTVDLIAQRSYSASETVSIIGSEYNTDMIGIQIAIPLYSGGAVSSAERQAQARLEQARLQYEAGRRQLTINLRREYNVEMLGVTKVRALEEALKSARLAYTSTKMAVKAGTRNILDVLNARQQIYQVQRDLDKARYDFVMGGLRLKAAAGVLRESDIETVNRWLDTAGR